jgi:aminomethyltransferase
LLREKEAAFRAARSVPNERQGSARPSRIYRVFRDGADAGELTSATLSPSLNYGIGMAYLTTPVPKPGGEIEIEIRGQKFPAVIEKKPLYKKSS